MSGYTYSMYGIAIPINLFSTLILQLILIYVQITYPVAGLWRTAPSHSNLEHLVMHIKGSVQW